MYVEHGNSSVSLCFEAVVSGLDSRGTFCVEHGVSSYSYNADHAEVVAPFVE